MHIGPNNGESHGQENGTLHGNWDDGDSVPRVCSNSRGGGGGGLNK